MLLTVKDLAWSIKQKDQPKRILSPLSFTLKQGEIVGIIGPNGAGKTSLLRCISQQISHYQGEILFQNKNMKQLGKHYLAQHIAVVNQLNDTVFKLSVYDVVRMGLTPHKSLFSIDTKADKQAITEALIKTDLHLLAQQSFQSLSGGEQQRALIARALVQKAQLLILDEPTNHLDVYYQHQILQLVTRLNLTVLMTIHDLNLASHYCPRLLLLNQGKLIADNHAEKVLQPALLSRVFALPCYKLADNYSPQDKVYFSPLSNSTNEVNND